MGRGEENEAAKRQAEGEGGREKEGPTFRVVLSSKELDLLEQDASGESPENDKEDVAKEIQTASGNGE